MRGIAAAVAVLVLFAGCGTEPRRDGTVTLVFKHARMFGDDPVPRLVAAFEARHPGVRVRTEALGSGSDEQHQFLVINLEGAAAGRGRSGPGFDVMMLDVIWVPEFARAGWLLDLTSALTPNELDPHFPAAAEAARWDGRVWALPWNFNVGVLYYRADLLASHDLPIPRTDAEIARAVATVQDTHPTVEGYVWQGKQYEGLTCNVLESLWAHGTALLGTSGEVLPDTVRAEAALARLRGWIERGVSPAWVSSADEELTRRAFGDGRALFMRNWFYAMDLFEAEGSPVRGKVGIAPLPRARADVEAPGATGGSLLGVSHATRHPEAAIAFVRFLASEEAQRVLAGGSVLPTRRALYHDPGLVAKRPHLPRFHDVALTARPRPVTPAYLMLSTGLQPEASAALVGVKSPARALVDARRQLTYALGAIR